MNRPTDVQKGDVPCARLIDYCTHCPFRVIGIVIVSFMESLTFSQFGQYGGLFSPGTARDAR